LFLLTIEKNTLRALEYYEYSPLDERRFILSENVDLFSLFSRESSGIDARTLNSLKNDANIESTTAFTLVEIPVLAKFGMFQFSLETDMPIFAVSDTSLTGSEIPMGISQLLIDFYNKEFSGTTPYFPLFTKEMLLGQKITLEFGKSKLFSLSTTPSTPVKGTITSVKNDYPWFGIMVGESLVKEKLWEIGATLGNPYKIVGYMKDPRYKDQIENTYSTKYSLEFDTEAIEKLKERTKIIRYILFVVGSIIFSIFLTIFSFLLLSYARERSDIYRLFQMLGINQVRSHIIVLLEPVLLLLGGLVSGGIFFRLIESYFLKNFSHFLIQKGIDFPLFQISFAPLLSLLFTLFCIISVVIFLVDLTMRRKRWI
jgi:hypothetical protein